MVSDVHVAASPNATFNGRRRKCFLQRLRCFVRTTNCRHCRHCFYASATSAVSFAFCKRTRLKFVCQKFLYSKRYELILRNAFQRFGSLIHSVQSTIAISKLFNSKWTSEIEEDSTLIYVFRSLLQATPGSVPSCQMKSQPTPDQAFVSPTTMQVTDNNYSFHILILLR